MMKNRRSKIQKIQEEIEELDRSIERALSTKKKAFAARLTMMKEKKIKLLEAWFTTP